MVEDDNNADYGSVGTRCEKPRSQGNERKRQFVCNKYLCCGSASGIVNDAIITIESCQPTSAKTY